MFWFFAGLGAVVVLMAGVRLALREYNSVLESGDDESPAPTVEFMGVGTVLGIALCIAIFWRCPNVVKDALRAHEWSVFADAAPVSGLLCGGLSACLLFWLMGRVLGDRDSALPRGILGARQRKRAFTERSEAERDAQAKKLSEAPNDWRRIKVQVRDESKVVDDELHTKLVTSLEHLSELPTYGQVALASRAARRTLAILQHEWRIAALHEAAKTLLDACDLVAEEATWLSPGMPRPGNQEEALELVGRHFMPRAKGAALNALVSLREAAITARDVPRASRGTESAQAREAGRPTGHCRNAVIFADRALASPYEPRSLRRSKARIRAEREALMPDVEHICRVAAGEKWDDTTPVARTFGWP